MEAQSDYQEQSEEGGLKHKSATYNIIFCLHELDHDAAAYMSISTEMKQSQIDIKARMRTLHQELQDIP